MASQIARPTRREMLLAAICLIVVLGGAFLAASLTKNDPIFQLVHPKGNEFDVFTEEQRLNLHQTFFTAWAALILVTPALCTFLFRRSSEMATKYWLAFWTVSLIAFLVHFCWAFFFLFDHQWNLIEKAHARVTAPIPDIIAMVWWALDVLLAWFILSEKLWIRIERVIIYLAIFVLFVLGSAKEGELWLSRALGYAMGAAVLVSFIIWLFRWLKKSKKGVVATA